MNISLQTVILAALGLLTVSFIVTVVQSGTSNFGDFSSKSTQDSGCGISKQQFCLAADSSGSLGPRASDIASSNTGCAWANGGSPDVAKVCG